MTRTAIVAALLTCICGVFEAAIQDVQKVIIRGKVTMKDGSALPKAVGIERVCSDPQRSKPGPLTDKQGHYVWQLQVDPFRADQCYLRAILEGYESTRINISNLSGYLSTTADLMPLTLMPRVPDPYIIVSGDDSKVPSKARGPWRTAMKAVDSNNLTEAVQQLQSAVAAAPKFAAGWHTLGIVLDSQGKTDEAKQAYQQAIESDPSMPAPYVTLTRIYLKAKDWPSAAKTADALIKKDTKSTYPEIYLHQAVARFEMKDLAGAEASAKEAIRAGRKIKVWRAEYVLGRIFETKGDLDGARDHISRYLEMDPDAPDAAQIRAYLTAIGKPAAGSPPALELL